MYAHPRVSVFTTHDRGASVRDADLSDVRAAAEATLTAPTRAAMRDARYLANRGKTYRRLVAEEVGGMVLVTVVLWLASVYFGGR